MSPVFGEAYSDVYDVIYREKNYECECAMLRGAFERFATTPVKSVLDLGCGTGNHSLRLASMGYQVVGVDASEAMLRVAEQKARQQRAVVTFRRADIRTVDLDLKFDAALMMFAVLGYQQENADVLNALKVARQHLDRGGLLIFDVWYGPAVLRERPGERLRVVETDRGKILRASRGQLDVHRHICRVEFRVWVIKGDRVAQETCENHLMRYFFPKELELFLDSSGFRMLRLGAFPDFDRNADDSTWNVLIVARAV
jgi:SAM-dependent methyltransferase